MAARRLSWLKRPATISTINTYPVTAIYLDKTADLTAAAFEHYTRLFCQHVIQQNDFLELFGCDIPRELQKHQLSVAYISLNLSMMTKRSCAYASSGAYQRSYGKMLS